MAMSKEIKALMKEFNIPFPPSKITGAKKSKKWVDWEAEDDGGLSKWKTLYAIWEQQTVKDRQRIQGYYSFTAVTIKKRNGIESTKLATVNRAVNHPNDMVVFRPSKLKNATVVLADLEARLVEKEDEVAKLKSHIKKLKALDDETLNAIVESLQGIG